MKACANYHTEHFMTATARQAILSSGECDATSKKGKQHEKAVEEESQMRKISFQFRESFSTMVLELGFSVSSSHVPEVCVCTKLIQR